MFFIALSCLLQPMPTPESIATPASSPTPLDSREHTVERRPMLMGTVTRLVVTGPTREEALATTVAIERILRSAEDELSTWTAGTELDRLNRTPLGQGVELSPELDGELLRALDCADATHGAFDPTVGALTEAWDLRGRGRHPLEEELENARRRTGWHLLGYKNGVWTRLHDVVIDEGGFGKGAALDRVQSWMRRSPEQRALIDLGGQLLLIDSTADPSPWLIDVADPDDRSLPILRFSVLSGSVATSANSERALGTTNGTIGHLLDPRSGRPASDFGSVTVWAPTALEADCLATGLFVAGPDAALEYAGNHPGIEVVVIERLDRLLSARASAGLLERIDVVSNRISLR